jgi:GTPase SAR1 family protein
MLSSYFYYNFRHFKNASGAIIVFDITNKETFLSVKNWIYEVKNNSENKVIIYLLGNKLDLDILRKVINLLKGRKK